MNRVIGVGLMAVGVIGILLYGWLVFFSPWQVLILQPAFMAVAAVFGILAWVGYALQAIRGQTPRLGQKIAKTEYHETPRRHPCAKHQKITLYYTQKGHKTVVQEY